jgi:hypothetical protein
MQHPSRTSQFDARKVEDYISSKIGHFVTQFNIPQITVEKLFDKLPLSKAAGPDAISIKVLMLVSPVFSVPLTRLFNLSMVKGVFPSKWNVARVTPLFKDGVLDRKIITGQFLCFL